MYLTDERKAHLDAEGQIVTAADLSYCLSAAVRNSDPSGTGAAVAEVIRRYLPAEASYDNLVIALGCLTTTHMEFERRWATGDNLWESADNMAKLGAVAQSAMAFHAQVIVPYYTNKIEQNGDVR